MKVRIKISRDFKRPLYRFVDLDFEDRPRIGDEVVVPACSEEDKLTPKDSVDSDLDITKEIRVRFVPLAVTWIMDEDGSHVPIMEALVLG